MNVRTARGTLPRQGTVVPWLPRPDRTDRDPRAGGPWRGFQGARASLPFLAAALAFAALLPPARAQQLDLTHGGPITITSSDGIEWRQQEREVIARGNAKAVRQNVTVTADRLIAFYRPKNGASPPQPAQTVSAADPDTGGNEVYRVEAEGHVRIFTPTDEVHGRSCRSTTWIRPCWW